MKTIDLRCDTVTLPTDEMIDAIAAAHMADRFDSSMSGEEMFVNELHEKVAPVS